MLSIFHHRKSYGIATFCCSKGLGVTSSLSFDSLTTVLFSKSNSFFKSLHFAILFSPLSEYLFLLFYYPIGELADFIIFLISIEESSNNAKLI